MYCPTLWKSLAQELIPLKSSVALLQERFERQRWRTKNARAARHARVLQRFWHTSSGLVWQDGLVAAMLLASLGLGAFQLALGAPRQAPAGNDAKADNESSS